MPTAPEGWKKRRTDKRTENYWKKVEERQGYLDSRQEYQKEWNFIETEYNDKPGNNGLDLGNPAFAFTDHSDHGKALTPDYKMEKGENAEQYWDRVRDDIIEEHSIVSEEELEEIKDHFMKLGWPPVLNKGYYNEKPNPYYIRFLKEELKMPTDLHAKVAAEILNVNPRVEAEVVDALVGREVKKRTDALVIVLDKLTKEENEFKKLGADLVTYNATGQKVDEAFSKKRVEERAKATGRIQKLTNAINKAIDKSDYGDVYNLAGGKDPAPSGAGDSETTDTAAD